jgi:predicted dehydrogenase
MTQLRLGLVGCGRLAERGWLPAIARVPDVRLVAVADRDTARCATAAPGVPGYAGAAELAQGHELDAAVVATPAEAHADDAAALTAAGIAVLVEKPPAPNQDDALRLAALVPAPWIGFNRRFDPRFRRLRTAIADMVDVALELRFQYQRAAWSPHVVRDDALLDVGSHLVDLARWLGGGEVRRVRAQELLPERAIIELELTRGNATIECAANATYRELVEARAADGALLGHAGHGGLREGVLRRLSRRPDPLVVSLAAELASFCAAARGEIVAELATANDGVEVLAAVDAARRSAATDGHWIEVHG